MILMKQILTKSVVGVDQKILKKPEDKGLSMLTPLFGFISIMSDREVRYQPLLMFIWKRESYQHKISRFKVDSIISVVGTTTVEIMELFFYFLGINFHKAVIRRALTMFFSK